MKFTNVKAMTTVTSKSNFERELERKEKWGGIIVGEDFENSLRMTEDEMNEVVKEIISVVRKHRKNLK